jgi:ribonuclease D
MSHIHVEHPGDADALVDALGRADRIALDCEAAGFHRYSDRLCLAQVTALGSTWTIDPLAFDATDLLREPLEREDLPIVMHGADFDLRLLSRDLGIRIRGLVDTQVYAALLGEEGLGLASLLESRIGVKLSKKYQRADWADRPLTAGMLEYAASDTMHLERLIDILSGELAAMGRSSWAQEECLALEAVADLPSDDSDALDPVTRIKGARHLPPREVTAIRAALTWRDEIAKQRDRAVFRVIGDTPLIEAVGSHPRRVEDLVAIKGFPGGLARAEGKDLLRRLRDVRELDEAELIPYPKNVHRGPGRPPPELEATVDRLKAVRNSTAEEIGLPRGTLLSNAVLLEIARAAPKTLQELSEVEGMRAWKVEVAGDGLLEALARG